MKKLLYITDQDEYMDHSFIAPLFETYLNKYLSVDIVYFTEFKSDFERKEKHRFTVPARYKNVLLAELNRNDVPIDSYAYIIVRNDIDIMKHVLREKDKYRYKTAFRLSIPKRRVKIRCSIAEGEGTFIDTITDKFKTLSETKIINMCDAFLPTSASMHEEFFPNVTTKTIICPPGIDPNMLHPNIQHEGEEKRFFYAGTLDKVREFETVLEAFSQISCDTWRLTISTRDTQYALEMVRQYKDLENNIEIHNAKNRDELLDLIAKADIGVALLPDYPIYNTSTPVKIFDYYSSAIPCIMTNSGHTNKIFTDCANAWFCKFEQNDIKEKIEYIISLSKESIADVGVKGQKILLDVKNYEKIAKNIAIKLEEL
ncbi:MAG: glycosyltransferase [Sulfurovum sp.]|nr:glycosyltransferase [Sulfurovum sp.]